jgi:alpha-ketoglutarate-dependent taurine dioxygenase
MYCIIDGNNRQLPPESLKDLVFTNLKTFGSVLLRNFSADKDFCANLVKELSVKTTIDPARALEKGVLQQVDAGHDAVGLHIENGTIPNPPHLCIFFCERAAATGSQTTICDGVEVFCALNKNEQQLFLETPLVYRRLLSKSSWQKYVAHELQLAPDNDNVKLEALENLVKSYPVTLEFHSADESVTYSYTTRAAGQTIFGQTAAWANSIFGPSYNYQQPEITLSGKEIDPALRKRLEEVTEEYTQEINWQDGDILILDNTRVMHGRRAIEDLDRSIYNALAYISLPK